MVLPLLAVAVAFTAPPAARGGTPASVAVAALNAQRERNGLPAGLTEQPLYDQGCALHNHYQHLNNELTHDEVLGKPGWTQLGSGGDGHLGEVLASAEADWSFWSNDGFGPWETAPYHLFSLLDPLVTSVGASANDGYSCMRSAYADDWSLDGPPRFYSYPGDGTTIYSAEAVEGELPSAPMEQVGIPQGTTTGPNILLFQVNCRKLYEADARPLVSANLGGPDGNPVETRLVNGIYGAAGGDLIPVKPLHPDRNYTVQANWMCADGSHAQQFSFRTRVEQTDLAVRLDTRAGLGAYVTPANVSGKLTISLTRNGHALKLHFHLAPEGVVLMVAIEQPRRGHYRLCATAGGGATGYTLKRVCVSRTI